MKTLYEQLVELSEKYYKLPDINKTVVETFYANKKNRADTVTSVDDFIERELKGADYEKVELIISPKKDFFKEFFGDENFKVTKDVKSKLHGFKLIMAEAGLISPLAVNPQQANIPTSFKKEKQAAFAKIQNVKSGANKSVTLEEAQAELVAVYVKYGKEYKPRVNKV